MTYRINCPPPPGPSPPKPVPHWRRPGLLMRIRRAIFGFHTIIILFVMGLIGIVYDRIRNHDDRADCARYESETTLQQSCTFMDMGGGMQIPICTWGEVTRTFCVEYFHAARHTIRRR